jgi:hypothetical protein
MGVKFVGFFRGFGLFCGQWKNSQVRVSLSMDSRRCLFYRTFKKRKNQSNFEKEIQFKIIAQQLKNSKEGFRKRTSSIFGNPATQYLATPQSLN